MQDRHDPGASVQPYTYPTLNVSSDTLLPHLSSRSATPTQIRPSSRLKGPSGPLHPPTRPRIIIPIERQQPTANLGQSEPPFRATVAPSPHPPSLPATQFTPSPRASPLSPQPHVSPSKHHSTSLNTQVTKSRSVFRPFFPLKLSKASRDPTAQSKGQGSRKPAEEAGDKIEMVRLQAVEEEATAREGGEEVSRFAAAQAKARETVKFCIRSLLLSGRPSEENLISVFSTCLQACKNVGLDLSTVLQEPLIEGQTPVFWAILNRPATSPEGDAKISDAIITALLNACGSLKEATISSVRLACMLTSDNTLLQHLFWNFQGLSPLSMRDRMFLGPSGGGDIVEVDEMRGRTSAFIAHMKIHRFRLRMNVSAIVKVEFVTFERIWTATFSASTEHAPGGPSENKWVFSLELANESTPACVHANLRVSGHSHQDHMSDNNESIFSVPVGGEGCALESGSRNAIKVRLDDGPMGLHWVNESLALVDADGTLHAQLDVRLTQYIRPIPTTSPDQSDAWSPISSTIWTAASSSNSHIPQSPTDTPSPVVGKSKRDRKAKDRDKTNKPDKPVYTSLRRGGR